MALTAGTRGWRRGLIYTLVGLAFFYMVDGMDAYRWARARIRAALQPPTIQQLARSTPEPPPPLRATLPPEAVRGKMWLSDPPRPTSVAIVLTSIVCCTVLAMYLTGRPNRS